MWGDTDKEERRRGGWRGQWLGAERDREGVAGRETDAPALLVMLAVVVLAVWDRRGRRTSQHFTLLSPPTWSSLCSAGFNPFFLPVLLHHPYLPSLSLLLLLHPVSGPAEWFIPDLEALSSPGGWGRWLPSLPGVPPAGCQAVLTNHPLTPSSHSALPPTPSHSTTAGHRHVTQQHNKHTHRSSPAAVSEDTRYKHNQCGDVGHTHTRTYTHTQRST